jgi:hypothetical protein
MGLVPCPNSLGINGIVKIIGRPESVLVLRHLFSADDLCIELESIRDMSMAPSLYIQYPPLRLLRFCLN